MNSGLSARRPEEASTAPHLLPYPAYKPSGLEWLPNVPAHWGTERGKWLLKKMKRPVRDTDEVVTCFRDGTVTLRKNRRTEGFTESLQEIGYQGIRAGDLVIHAMDAFAGATGVADSDGKGTPVYAVCRPESHVNAYYFAYILREMARSQWIAALAKGIRERSTDFRFATLAPQRLPLPPLAEQRAIACYLDHVDGRIQRYIEAKDQLIALLQEARQAIIQRAVTRGLDPDVPLKPSGVDWLGDVPAHWEAVQLGRIGRFSKGSGGTKADEVPEGVPCIRYGDLYTSHRFHIRASRSYVSETDALNYTPLRYGDILFAGSGETIEEIGKSAANLLEQSACCGGDVILFRTERDVDPVFSGYAFDCPQSQYQKSTMGRGFTVMHIYGRELKYLWIALPPLPEQRAIAAHLDQATAAIDASIDNARRQSERMAEYRASLIAHVVTGKLDVRAAANLRPEGPEQESPVR